MMLLKPHATMTGNGLLFTLTVDSVLVLIGLMNVLAKYLLLAVAINGSCSLPAT